MTKEYKSKVMSKFISIKAAKKLVISNTRSYLEVPIL